MASPGATRDTAAATGDPFASVFQVLRSSLAAQVAQTQRAGDPSTNRTTTQCANEERTSPLNAWPHSVSSEQTHLSHYHRRYREAESVSSTTDAFLSILAARHPNVKASLLESVHHERSYSSARIQALRSKRKQARVQRKARMQEWQQQKHAMARDCAHVVQQVETNETMYTQFATQAVEDARARLQVRALQCCRTAHNSAGAYLCVFCGWDGGQTLFFECIAEMKKALDRIDGFSVESTDESESMVHEHARQFEWELFLARLEEDVSGSLCFSQLYPQQRPIGAAATDSSGSITGAPDGKTGVTSTSSQDVKALMQNVLLRNGPMLDSGHTLQVRRIVAIAPNSSATSAPTFYRDSKGKPSLHFGDSGASLWTDIVRHSATTATRAATLPNSSRRLRRLPSRMASTYSTNCSGEGGGACSEVRQIAAKSTAQYPHTECDVPLSSAYIRWFLLQPPSRAFLTEPLRGGSMAPMDSNIYFSLEEYEANFASAMHAQVRRSEDASASLVTDKAIFASARRSLQELNAVLERTRRGGSGDGAGRTGATASSSMFQLVCARTEKTAAEGNDASEDAEQATIFMRASVLQLLQTAYYSAHFLRRLPPGDVVFLEQLCGSVYCICIVYPTSLFGAGILSKLYVPFSGVDKPSQKTPTASEIPLPRFRGVTMKPLDEHSVHELLLVYIARGKHGNDVASSSSTPSHQLTSLAASDSISVLLPKHLASGDQQSAPGSQNPPVATHQCTIKNPGSLWKKGTTVAKRNGASDGMEPHFLSAADSVFVEYQVLPHPQHPAPQPKRKSSAPRAATDMASRMHAIFGRGCCWRSCLASAETPTCSALSSTTQPLCAWHGILKQFLSLDDAQQYLLSAKEVHSCVVSLDNPSRADAAKRMVQKSSSLLDLVVSIGTFFEHVQVSFSNRRFEKEGMSKLQQKAYQQDNMEGEIGGRVLEELAASVDAVEQILSVERNATKEVQRLIQLTVYPGVDVSMIRNAYFEMKEFDTDVRTLDPELILRLSTRKLQLLRRRREEEEARIRMRLTAQSQSTSMIAGSTFGASLDQVEQNAFSPVYDVVHVLRKGRKSLQQQQQQRIKYQPSRPQSASSSRSSYSDASGLSRSVSETLHPQSHHPPSDVKQSVRRVNNQSKNHRPGGPYR